MKYKTCTFIGHRKIEITNDLIKKLEDIIEDLIIKENVGVFLFGSRSQFNDLCHRIVCQAKEKYPNIKRIAYTCRSEGCVLESDTSFWNKWKDYFDQQQFMITVDEEYEHKTKYTSGRGAYVERNYAMIDDSDICVFYYNKRYTPNLDNKQIKPIGLHTSKSGTKSAYNYAKHKNKK